MNQPFTTSYTVTNTGTSPFNLQSLDVVVRDPNNKPVLSLGDSNNVPISPQASRSFSLTVPSIASRCKTCNVGTYTVSAAVLLLDGTLWNALPVTNGAQNSVQVNVIAHAFTIVPSPNTPDGCRNLFWATSASSKNDVWAVGSEQCGNPYGMLIEHWDGTQWSIISNPPLPSQSGGELFAVSAQSATDVWVMGYVTVPYQTEFVAYWSGSKWTVIPTQIFPYFSQLSGIKALSANNVWVVGEYNDGNIGKTMIANWNGTQWNIVPSPTPASSYCAYSDCFDLVSVTATSSTGAWAMSPGFIEHWNGAQWSIVFTSSTGINTLNGITASSPKDVWAVGMITTGNSGQPLVEHWNDTQWSAIPTPPISGSGELNGVIALSSNSVWVVGEYYPGGTLTEFYS